jgi:hypothetical protein
MEKQGGQVDNSAQRNYTQFHGRRQHHEHLLPLYGRNFLTTFIERCEEAYKFAAPITAEKSVYGVSRFLRWLGAAALEDEAANAIVLAFQQGRGDSLSASKFLAVVNSYANKIRNIEDQDVTKGRNSISRRSLLIATSMGLRTLAKYKIWPKIPSLRAVRLGKIRGGRSKSLGELSISDRRDAPVEAELPKILEKQYEHVQYLNRVRLHALRELLSKTLQHEYSKYLCGQKMLRQVPSVDLEIFDKVMRQEAPISPQVKAYFSRDPSQPPDEGLALLLNWLVRCNGVSCRTIDLPFRAQRMIAAYGGCENIYSYFEGRRRALTAAFGLVLIDSAFNVQTCNDLPANPFVGKVVRGNRRIVTISARKNRSAGQLVEATLSAGIADLQAKHSSCLNAVAAIEIWTELSLPIRERAKANRNEEHKYLWILPAGKHLHGNISRVDKGSAIWSWKQLLNENKDHPVIGGLDIPRSMIRTTLLQIRAAENNFDHAIAQTIANHKSARTTMTYLSQPWFKQRLADEIRRFQELFEAAFLSDIEHVATKLEIAPQDLLKREKLASETGLGFVCAQRLTASKFDTPSGSEEECLALDKCAECGFRKFVPTENSIRALLWTNKSLKKQQTSYMNANPDRWDAVWLPLLALTEAVLSKLRSGAKRGLVQRIDRDLKTDQIPELTLW